MPAHLVADDIARGSLKVIRPVAFDAQVAKQPMGVAYRVDRALGPAGQWMIEHLSELATR